MRCAVGKCKQSNSKKSSRGKSIHFYSFPKDAAQKQMWIKFCNRVNAINTKNERICSLHFKEDDFEKNLKFEMGFSNRRAPKLKSGTVPTIDADNFHNEEDSKKDELAAVSSDIKKQIEIGTIDNKSTPMSNDTNTDRLQLYIENLKAQINTLRNENDMLKMSQTQSTMTIQQLSSQVEKLTLANENLEKSLRRLFTEGQIKKLKSGDKRQNFSETDIAQSFTLYSMSAKAYQFLKKKHFPLPSVRTLQRWSQKLDVSTGVLEPVEKILPAANQMSETQKLSVLSFDEIKAEEKIQ